MIARFDGLAANPGTRTSRRSVLAVLACGILGVSAVAPADAARTKKKNKSKRKANRSSACPAAQQCGSVCCGGKTVCADAAKGVCSREGEMVGV